MVGPNMLQMIIYYVACTVHAGLVKAKNTHSENGILNAFSLQE